MKKLIVLILIPFLYNTSFGQKLVTYKWLFEIQHVDTSVLKDNDTIICGMYTMNSIRLMDTAVYKNKQLLFTGKKELNTGVYSLILGNNTYFDFIVTTERPSVHFKADITDITKTQALISDENNFYYKSISTIEMLKRELDSLNTILSDTTITVSESTKNQISKAKDKISKKGEELKNKYFEDDDLYAQRVLRMTVDIEAPDTIDSTKIYSYIKKHYFDNIDFSDDELVHSAIFYDKISNYFRNFLVQSPDSIIADMERIIAKTSGDSSYFFQAIISFVIVAAERSNIMGMDGVFTHFGLKYFKTGKSLWFNKKTINKIVERAEKLLPINIGKKAPHLCLVDTSEKKWIDIYNVDSDYTVLIFWAEYCGHCKTALPKLAELCEKYDTNQVKIYAVETSLETANWKKFLRKNPKMMKKNWINVSDTPELNKNAGLYIYTLQKTSYESLDFRKTYDIYRTPKIFLLDKNKKIIAKKIDVEQLRTILDRELHQSEPK